MAQPPEKSVEHLLRKSMLLKNKCSASHRIIQSRLTNQSLEVASQSELNLNLSKQKNVFKVCQWCFCYWSKGAYSFKIEPQKHTCRFIRSLLNKDIETLTEMQLKQRNKYTGRRNKMVLKCHVCNKETKVTLQKPDRISEKIQSSELNSLPMKSKKKKKKKDSFAGLKSEAIMKCKTSSADKQSTLLGAEDKNSKNTTNSMATSTTKCTIHNSSTTSKNANSILNIQNKPSKKKKNKLNIGKLKFILGKEKKSNVSTITSTVSKKKNNNSLLSAFLTSL